MSLINVLTVALLVPVQMPVLLQYPHEILNELVDKRLDRFRDVRF